MIKPLLPLVVLFTAGFLPANAQEISATPPEIVSGWKLNGGDTVITFLFDGTFYLVDGSGPRPGMERGIFQWDKESGEFTCEALRDTNGDAGFSHPIDTTSVAISGNTLTYTVAGEGSFTFSRITSATQTIVGSWFIPEEKCMLTLLADNTYYICQEVNDAPYGYDGAERGTYQWNPATKAFTAIALVDTSGDTGFSSLNPGVTTEVVGNSMVLTEGNDHFTLRRVNANAAVRIDNDFEVSKFTKLEQTSGSAPTVDEYTGASSLGGISGSGGTLKIGNQATRAYNGDDLKVDYSSLAALEATTAFPNGANYLIQRSGGSATLTYPAGGSFPSVARIAAEGGEWEGGDFLVDSKNLISWTPVAGYDPATNATLITVQGEDEDEYLIDAVMPGDVTSFDFSSRLTPGAFYEVTVQHLKMANSTTAGTGLFAGKLGYALTHTSTRFNLRAFEDESSEPPVITEPVTKTVNTRTSVILTVGVEDEAGVTCQWLQDGEEIPGQTGNSLALFSLTDDDYGSYRVKLTNAAGSVTSGPVEVFAIPDAPEITVAQPAGSVLSVGSTRDFGAVPLGGKGELVFTLGNIGTLDLADIAVSFTGADAGEFSVVTAPAATLPPSGSVAFTVRFSPDSFGTKAAVLRLSSNDGDENPFTVALTATASDPLLLPNPPAAPVVNPVTGKPEQTVSISNTGTLAMSGLQLRIGGLPEGVTITGGTKATGGTWLLDHSAIIKGGKNVAIVIQYQFTGAPVSFTPAVAIVPVAAAGPADPAFTRAVKGLTANLAAGTSALHVRTVPGRRYEIWHTANLTAWQLASGGIFARSESLSWTDDGSETGQPPSRQVPRFYRVNDVTE